MNPLYYYDEHIAKDAYDPFIKTDLFIDWVQKNKRPFLHFWQLEDTFILGMKDTRVDDLKSGLEVIQSYHYTPIVRNAGGLGVINDLGVLNVSLFLPNKNKELSIEQAYEQMTKLIKDAFFSATYPIEAYEISDSYCPGTYDLSIHRKKIAGIAQRRVKEGIAIMLYLSVNGNQAKRGEIVRHFYQHALKEHFGKKGFPAVNPESMTNLSTYFPDLTLLKAKKALLRSFKKQFQSNQLDDVLPVHFLNQEETRNEMQKKYIKMNQRNEIISQFN